MIHVTHPIVAAGMTARRSIARAYFALPLFALALAACGKDAPAGADTPRTAVKGDTTAKENLVTITKEQASRIHLADVNASSFQPSIHTTGTVAFNGDRSTQVLAPLSGPITRIMVEPGSVVRKGEALATVTSPDFASAMSAYRKAQSAYRNAQRISDLDEQLFKNDAISRRELEQAQTDAAGAVADRDAAIEQMRALGVDESAIAAVKDNKPTAQLQAVIRAPIDGTVVEKLVNPGQLIQAGTTACFTIADLSTVWVMANVFESDLSVVQAGENASVMTGASLTPIAGRVEYVGSLVDPSSKATAVRILAPNPHDVLKRDMLVNVDIHARQSRSGILIPTSAVLRDDQNLPFVYMVRPNNQFARRGITLASRVGDQYEVKTGLVPGERIVVDGSLFLQFAGSQ